MQKLLRQFLARLEAIDEDHDGLGDTSVREQMRDDVLRGFLLLEPGFTPSGEYGLNREAIDLSLAGVVIRAQRGGELELKSLTVQSVGNLQVTEVAVRDFRIAPPIRFLRFPQCIRCSMSHN